MSKNSNASRWGLVTFATCVTTGTVGHFTQGVEAWWVPVVFLAFLFAMIGWLAIAVEE